jgi:histidinol phosphatase-like PHP family hydrolase
MPLDASAVAKLLHEFGQRTALRGGNPYRARAYSRAALGHQVDIDTVLEACARHGVAVEVNSNPWRLDLDWRGHQRALELGCMMSINPDAHSTAEIDLAHWGVEMARKGGVPQDRVLNCLELSAFTQYTWRNDVGKRKAQQDGDKCLG